MKNVRSGYKYEVNYEKNLPSSIEVRKCSIKRILSYH